MMFIDYFAVLSVLYSPGSIGYSLAPKYESTQSVILHLQCIYLYHLH